LSDFDILFSPDTLLRWHHELVVLNYRPKRRTGRASIVAVMRKMRASALEFIANFFTFFPQSVRLSHILLMINDLLPLQ